MKRLLGNLFIALFVVLSPSCYIDEEHNSTIPTTKAEWSKVYEYTPAPGQFINDTTNSGSGFDGTQTTPEKAIQYAESRLEKGSFVSLGGFGGYIIVGFDHNVLNAPRYDFEIMGNPNPSSSEPGVVWVMKDENGNGLPDDTWYELSGSETGKAETVQDYAITYYRPTAPKMAVRWTDNLGGSGEINHITNEHSQDYYYPLWITEDSYTLRGTRLEARNYDKAGDGKNWVLPPYDWGYSDNYSATDYISSERSNRFDISNAIEADGKSVELDYINFVKVQCAVNAQSGHLGEVSTEVCGFKDLNIDQI